MYAQNIIFFQKFKFFNCQYTNTYVFHYKYNPEKTATYNFRQNYFLNLKNVNNFDYL